MMMESCLMFKGKYFSSFAEKEGSKFCQGLMSPDSHPGSVFTDNSYKHSLSLSL